MLRSNDQKQQRDSAAVQDAQNAGASSANLQNNDALPEMQQSASLDFGENQVSASAQDNSQLRRQSLDLQPARAIGASSMNTVQQSKQQLSDQLKHNEEQRKGSNSQAQELPNNQAISSSQPANMLSLNEQLVNAVQSSTNNAAKRGALQSSKSPRRQGVVQQTPAGQSPKRAITASNIQKQMEDNASAASASAATASKQGTGKLQKNSATAGQQQRSSQQKGPIKNKSGTDASGKGSAGNQRKQTAGEIKLLSSQQNVVMKGQSNRSNSISRRSGASNSSMVVNQAAADAPNSNTNNSSSAQKKGKPMARPLPRQRANLNQSENTTKKGGEKAGAAISSTAKAVTSLEKQSTQLDKAKIAEEIKLNVAAVGMDLLNNSGKAAAPTLPVNNPISPKTNNLMMGAADSAGIDGDDEGESPAWPPSSQQKAAADGGGTVQGNQPGQKDKGKISIQHIENTEESDDEDALLDAARNESDDGDDDDDFARRIKMSAMKQIELPPPLELIAKTVYKEEEPIKTGAPIAFVSLAQMAGGRFKNEEACGKTKAERQAEGPEPEPFPVDLKPDVATLRANTTNIQQYMASMNENGYVVYCRFGREYIGHLAKQHQLMINNPNLSSHMRQIATYLINIKKLVKDHNIESDSKDFNKLKTCGKTNMKKKSELPPTPFYIPTGPEDKTLIFESRFETGNLLASMKISDNEYDMVLQNDINTNGHTQWFFFRVSNTRRNLKVKFNILNLAKPDSLYNEGMRVLSFSQLSRDGPEQLSWHRVGTNISYHTNTFRREGNRWNRCYYTLTFTHTFTETNDQVYFAHCFPYTYTDLCDDLSRIERDRFSQNFVNRSTLCRTLAGNRCEYITITSKERDPNSEKSKAKKGVFISSRVHPGESNASWMMKGVIEFLVSNTAEAQALRENFVFKIVPMLNPDGVINGNYRCSLAGQDLNRRWKIPSKTLHPVNWHVKRMIRDFNREREIALVCDLHGHSRRKNIFMYGNNFDQRPHATRVFPFIMSKLLDFFSFEYSRFSVHKSKEATARVTLWRELKIPNVFTMEASFCGANKGLLDNKHFMPEHLMLAGRKLLEGLIVYTKLQVNPLKPSQIAATANKPQTQNQPIIDLEEEKSTQKYTNIRMQEIEKELTTNKQLIEMTKGDEDGEDSACSDSEPSEDNLSEEEMAKIIPVKRKESLNKIKEKGKKPELVRKNSGKRLDEKSPSARGKQQPQLQPRSNPTRSPIKRIFPYQNPYDRMMRRGLKKVEMVDAWTQTSNRGSDTEDSKKQKSKTQPPQIKHGHQRMASNNGGVLLNEPNSTSSQQARGSVENIYHPQSHDAKSLQLQQDRRLAQIHRQNTQEQNKMGLAVPVNDRQFSTGKAGSNHFPHTSNQQSTHQLSNASPSVMPASQIRIRKDPIKHQPSYKKPPNLAIYEEALLKQTSGGIKGATMSSNSGGYPGIQPQGGSFKQHQNHHLHQTMRSSEPPDSMIKLPKQSMQGEVLIGQQPLIDGRSPALIKSQNKLAIDQQQHRGKTFTATRLGNFPTGKNDQHFFHYKGQNDQQLHPSQQAQQMKMMKPGQGSNELIMNANSHASNKQRVFINNTAANNQISGYSGVPNNPMIKSPDSPSKRAQNYAVNNLVVTTGASSRKASVNQRSPLLSSSMQVNQQQNSANKQQIPQHAGNTRESYHFRGSASTKDNKDQPQLVGQRPIPNKQHQQRLVDPVKSRNPETSFLANAAGGGSHNLQKQQPQSQQAQLQETQQSLQGITPQKLAEFRSNRSTQQQNKQGAAAADGGSSNGNQKI